MTSSKIAPVQLVVKESEVGIGSTDINCVTPPVVFKQDEDPTLRTQYVVLVDKLAVVYEDKVAPPIVLVPTTAPVPH